MLLFLQLALYAQLAVPEPVVYDESHASESDDSPEKNLEILERLARHNDYDHETGYVIWSSSTLILFFGAHDRAIARASECTNKMAA